MKYIFTLLLFCGALAGCSSNANKTANVEAEKPEPRQDTIASPAFVKNKLPLGKIYDFLGTKDPKFCNLDSLVEGDCNSGYFYFTPKGNVIYRYLCVNSTEEEYFVGTGSFNEKGLLLSFEDSYTYQTPDEYEAPTLKQMNNGKMQKSAFSLQLTALKNCPNTYGYATNDEYNEYYLIHEAPDQAEKNHFLTDLRKIKALQQY